MVTERQHKVTTWADIKALAISKSLELQYFESASDYFCFLSEGNVIYCVSLWKDGHLPVGSDASQNSTDRTDFIDNHQATANKPFLSKAVLRDDSGNPIGVFDDSGTKRIQVQAIGVPGGAPNDVRLKDGIDNFFATVTQAGALRVDAAPAAPPGTTHKSGIGTGGMNGTVDEDYTITNGKTLVVQQFSGGGEVSVTGNRMELVFKPDANPINEQLISVGYASGSSFETTINQEFVGDGTAKLTIRRVNMTGGVSHITGSWVGYEKD